MLLIEDGAGGVTAVQVRNVDRLKVRAQADRLDRRLADGSSPDYSVALALRAQQLVGLRERRQLAAGLRRALSAARPSGAFVRTAVVNRRGVLAASAELHEACDLLESSRPLAVAGIAEVAVLLRDGTGPLYGTGANRDLGAVLRVVLGRLVETATAH